MNKIYYIIYDQKNVSYMCFMDAPLKPKRVSTEDLYLRGVKSKLDPQHCHVYIRKSSAISGPDFDAIEVLDDNQLHVNNSRNHSRRCSHNSTHGSNDHMHRLSVQLVDKGIILEIYR